MTQPTLPTPNSEENPHMASNGSKPTGYTPPRLTSAPPADEKRFPLFYIDDTEYSIPAKPRANIALNYLITLREDGEGAAQVQLLNDMLGTDAVQALRNCKSLSLKDFEEMVSYITKLAMGRMEDDTTEGNS